MSYDLQNGLFYQGLIINILKLSRFFHTRGGERVTGNFPIPSYQFPDVECMDPLSSPSEQKVRPYTPVILGIEYSTHQGHLNTVQNGSLDTRPQLTISLEILKDPNWRHLVVDKYDHPGIAHGGCLCGDHGLVQVPTWCGDYLCIVCQKVRSGRKYHTIMNKIVARSLITEPVEVTKGGRTRTVPPWTNELRFLTLTTRPVPSLNEAWTNLQRYLKKFKQRQAFKKYTRGGAFGIEIHYYNKVGHEPGWRFDVHMIVEGDFWPVEDIRKNWKDISGAEQVWIEDIDQTGDTSDEALALWDDKALNKKRERQELIWGLGEAVLEVTKYITKPTESMDWPDIAKREYQTFMQGGQKVVHHIKIGSGIDEDLSYDSLSWTGRKMIRTFGEWYDIPDLDEQPDEAGGQGIERFETCWFCGEILFPKFVLNLIGDLLPQVHDEEWRVKVPWPAKFKPVQRAKCKDCLNWPCGVWEDWNDDHSKVIKRTPTTERNDRACSDIVDRRIYRRVRTKIPLSSASTLIETLDKTKGEKSIFENVEEDSDDG